MRAESPIRGHSELSGNRLPRGSGDYNSALRLDSAHAGALNNLAMTLLERGCPHAARLQLEKIDVSSLDDVFRESMADAARQID